eukprot:scaffold90793_cov18-Prasinocladus_malaysianus.AAC.2
MACRHTTQEVLIFAVVHPSLIKQPARRRGEGLLQVPLQRRPLRGLGGLRQAGCPGGAAHKLHRRRPQGGPPRRLQHRTDPQVGPLRIPASQPLLLSSIVLSSYIIHCDDLQSLQAHATAIDKSQQ